MCTCCPANLYFPKFLVFSGLRFVEFMFLCEAAKFSVFGPKCGPRLWSSVGVDLDSSLLSLGWLVQLPEVWFLIPQYTQILLLLPVLVGAQHMCSMWPRPISATEVVLSTILPKMVIPTTSWAPYMWPTCTSVPRWEYRCCTGAIIAGAWSWLCVNLIFSRTLFLTSLACSLLLGQVSCNFHKNWWCAHSLIFERNFTWVERCCFTCICIF